MSYLFISYLVYLCHVGVGEEKKEKVEEKKEKIESFNTYLFPIMKNNNLLAKFSKPLSDWSFIALINKENNNMEIVIIKDSQQLLLEKKFIDEMNSSFLKISESLKGEPFIFAMNFKEGKRKTLQFTVDKTKLNTIKNIFSSFKIPLAPQIKPQDGEKPKKGQ